MPDGLPAATAILKPRRARPFFGRHPWVLESAIDRVEGGPADGDVVLGDHRSALSLGEEEMFALVLHSREAVSQMARCVRSTDGGGIHA